MARIIGGKKATPEARFKVAALMVGYLLAAVLVAPVTVFAAVATAPDAGGGLDVQTWADSGQLIVVMAVAVPEDVKLPTTVRVPVPVGATVQWAGEVLGGDLNADPARPYKIIKSPVGGQYAEFTLEQTRTAQVDADMPTLKINGDITSASFEWIQSVASPFTSFSMRVPANASDPNLSPQPSTQPETNSEGERLYSGDPLNLKPGQKQTVTFSYSTAAVSSAARAGGMDPLVLALIAALVVAVVALFVVLARQRQSAGPTTPARLDSPGSATRGETPDDESQSVAASDDDWGFDDES